MTPPVELDAGDMDAFRVKRYRIDFLIGSVQVFSPDHPGGARPRIARLEQNL
jgi:hypothetical protein